MKKLTDLILKKAKKQRKRIGIGIIKIDNEILTSLNKAKKIVDVVIYGRKIPGLNCIEFFDYGKAARQMVKDFKEEKIDQFVRGQFDDFYVTDEFKRQFNINPREKRIDVSFMEDASGWQFFITGISNPDLNDLKDKIRVITGLTGWLKKQFDLELKVAAMATCRPGSYGKNKEMDKTYDEAEAVAKYLKRRNINTRNVNIEIEEAKKWGANLVLPARGMIGNQIFRTILYLGGGKNYFCPTIFSGKGVYADNSRNEKDWFYHLIFAQYLANYKNYERQSD